VFPLFHSIPSNLKIKRINYATIKYKSSFQFIWLISKGLNLNRYERIATSLKSQWLWLLRTAKSCIYFLTYRDNAELKSKHICFNELYNILFTQVLILMILYTTFIFRIMYKICLLINSSLNETIDHYLVFMHSGYVEPVRQGAQLG
jgi:hypothetical protein